MPAQSSDSPGDVSWASASPDDAVSSLSRISTPWWVAGGWAIDLFLGKKTRSHGDLDIGVLRRDIPQVLRLLSGWETFEAKSGSLTRLNGSIPHDGVNSLWCRRIGVQAWELEFMLDDSDGEFWVYRRDPGIRRSLRDLVRHTSGGIPYLAPEVQLLYKAKQARPRDELDFVSIVRHLEEESRNWLRQSLAQTIPGHPWISALEG